MGRFVYWMNVSLDLKVEATDDEQGSGEWLRIDEKLHREFNARARALSMSVEGRVIYETMERFWPQAQSDASLPDFLREYGEIWTTLPKILVSSTRTTADFNTRIVSGPDVIEQLAAIRSETEGDIGVGGVTLTTQLLRAGMVDELLLFVHPVILGRGRPLFDGDHDPIELDLLESGSFSSGVAMHRYSVRAAR